jgi:EAL domain-containing protein (putative c-di-GMP-specific phosphodiesterase class I)
VNTPENEARAQAILAAELAEAVATEQFALHYQPQLDLVTSRVEACEALVRWEHPRRGTLQPDAFLPLAARIGALAAIDAWVMRSAFAAAAQLRKVAPRIRLHVNLSQGQAADPATIDALCAAANAGVDLESLGADIDAADALRDVTRARRTCEHLRRLGMHVAIDDFAGEPEDLARLTRLPIDALKIQRKIIETASYDAVSAEMLDVFAATFGFTSVVEGIETHAHVQWVRNTPLRVVQGFALCRPLPFPRFKDWLVTAQTMVN